MKATPYLSNGLWFDKEAEAAARFYISVFPDSAIDHMTYYGKEGFEFHQQPEGSLMAITFNLSGTEFVAINGGPLFQLNASISYFVLCQTETEADRYWEAFSDGGTVMMPLDKYAWSEKYGWIQDRFGLSWQIMIAREHSPEQLLMPSFMFAGAQQGRAEEAVQFYTSVFRGTVDLIVKQPEGPMKEQVEYAQFKLIGETLAAMDSNIPMEMEFNEALSLIVNCRTQAEIDYYWKYLTEGGQEVQCGWLKDKFGVSWQVVPVQLEEMLRHPDKARTERVTKAFMAMKKFDINELEKAFNG